MNFRRWNYQCAFYCYYLIMEKIYKITIETFYIRKNGSFTSFIDKRHVSRFFDEMSKKRQRCCC
jgi:hypothetical protein